MQLAVVVEPELGASDQNSKSSALTTWQCYRLMPPGRMAMTSLFSFPQMTFCCVAVMSLQCNGLTADSCYPEE